MNCRRIEPLLSRHLDGSLSEAGVEKVLVHLADCPACRRLRDQFVAIGSRLREPVAADLAPDVDHHAIEQWLAERASATPIARQRLLAPCTPSLPTRPILWGFAAAGMFVAILAGARWDRSQPVGPSMPLARAVTPHAPMLPPSGSEGGGFLLTRGVPQAGTLRAKKQMGAKGQSIRKAVSHEFLFPGFLASSSRSSDVARSPLPCLHVKALEPPARVQSEKPVPAARRDDLAFVNGDPNGTVRQWVTLGHDQWDEVEARVRRQVPVRDDFVQIPFPRLVSRAERQIAQAVESYKREAAVVDPRLSREVSCAVKATALSDLCDQLSEQAGVFLSAGPGAADEKVTLFVKDQPLRDLMRQLSHAFGYTWLRSKKISSVEHSASNRTDPSDPSNPAGSPHFPTPSPRYRYELVQDLRSQLLEEELRNQDLHAAMLALDAQMAAFQPYLSMSRQELETRWPRAGGPEKELLGKMGIDAQGVQGWGAVQMYHRLTPAQRLALMNGEKLEFSLHAPQPDQRLSPEWRLPLLRNSPGMTFSRYEGTRTAGNLTGRYPPETPLAQIPEAMPVVSLRIDRSEAGQLSLKVGDGAYFGTEPSDPGEYVDSFVVGQNLAAVKPDNAAANRSLRDQSAFRRVVSFRPKPSCPRFAASGARPDERFWAEVNSLGRFEPEPPHVSAADVWEAVHRATGLNILADSYSRFYPVPPVTVERRPLFDALCQVAGALGARWKKEDHFLVCRSAGFFWDKQKEVPNRLLSRWQHDSRRQHGLPLEDLLEMAALSDQQLGSATVGQVIEHCWGLEEWGLVGRGYDTGLSEFAPGTFRDAARYLAVLTPEQRRRAQSPGWLACMDLLPAQQQALAHFLLREGFSDANVPTEPAEPQPLAPSPLLESQIPFRLRNLRFQFLYAPSGLYRWRVSVQSREQAKAAKRWPQVVDLNRERALAAAQRIYPPARPADIWPTRGLLSLTFTRTDGTFLFDLGREPAGWSAPE